ncbi:hypothetical protein Afil01_18850 [Actinorhabdospora filicis]|uniref:Uncharacterized protein n=2 Tax=Actinorhabdospora filicis TaxID=1785913 RepID=A0A9W6W8K8_9ACTN|nr:hypothetical protein Afil01_18850 [Actinorhabdospora filicis]
MDLGGFRRFAEAAGRRAKPPGETMFPIRQRMEKLMRNLADRLLNRLVPKQTAWACRLEICGSTPTHDCHACCNIRTGACSPCSC